MQSVACIECPTQSPTLNLGRSCGRGGVAGPMFMAASFWLILLMSSVSFQYFSMAAAPCASMSSNTGFSSASSFSCIILAMCSGLLYEGVLCACTQEAGLAH